MKERETNASSPRNIPTARTVKQSRFSVIWLVPILAGLAAGYLLYDRVKNNGPLVTITFASGEGLQPGQTPVRYRGVKVGTVRAVELSQDGQKVEVAARFYNTSACLACAGSVFWVVRPEVGIGGLKGLETIVSGAYVRVEPGHGKPQKKFIGSDQTPTLSTGKEGLELILTSRQIGTLNSGAPVYYRGMEVGTVQNLALSEDATDVNIHVQIERRYEKLVRENTVFWNAGGLNVSLKLFGINVSAESVKALVIGGIAFATPPVSGAPVTAMTVFALHEKPEDKWLKWAPPMAGWAGSEGPPTNPLPANSLPSVGSLATNGVP